MFEEAGSAADVLDTMAEPFRLWLTAALRDQRYFGWVVEADGAAVGGIGMMIIEWAPHPLHPVQDHRGHVLNVFVEPAHRGQGLATKLVRMAQDEARRRGVAFMVLHATDAGRPVYEKLGWRGTSEMAISMT
jgi:GNAT superfamily N-acetyltransferase